jgi:hypothetical protein
MSTPLQIAIALHYWTRADDYGLGNGDDNFNASAVRDQRSEMCAYQLIEANEPGAIPRYKAGPALECYINALCALPWPEQKWVMP